MRVIFLGTYEREYDRNVALREALSRAGVELVEFHAPLWEGYENKAAGGSKLKLVWQAMRAVSAWIRLGGRYLVLSGRHDLVLVPYPGHVDLFPARVLTWLRRKPLVFDAFISMYDTLVQDRAMLRSGGLGARLAWALDHWSCRLADHVLVDTQSHADYFGREFKLNAAKVSRLFVAADYRYFYPEKRAPRETFTVFHYSKFAPIHGLPTIFKAAEILQNEKIDFLLVGEGQMSAECERLRIEFNLKNLRHQEWMTRDELRQTMSECQVTLGIFGTTEKAARVIPNKVYQAMAVGVAFITADTPGTRELLRDGENCLLVPPGDAQALADAILRLMADSALRQSLGRSARQTFAANCTPESIGANLLEIFERKVLGLQGHAR